MSETLHRLLVSFAALALACFGVAAHESQIGAIAIVHAYATPTLAGSSNGAAYFTRLENQGSSADRLVSVSTPAASRVEIHTMAVDAQGVMRMREIDGVALAPKAAVQMRPGMGTHLMLIGLKAPLKEGARFPMTLQFERAGKVDVQVVVQAANAGDAPAPSAHGH